ncbi:MAG: type II secretion system GspH family protein [Candidatus Omnitrophica bacterium]|nr:type II secretion system GspH family protein [Candidatus Omnitrophota bacterium]
MRSNFKEPLAIKGFTLIELLIVIAILGILVSLILPRFSDVQTEANTKVCIANMRGLASAMAIYEVRKNANGTWGTSPYVVSSLVTWGYLAAEPYCPYELETKASYVLVAGLTSSAPDDVDCPNGPAPNGDASYTEHVWP